MANKTINKNIVCAYLYVISKYGYPPQAESYLSQIQEMSILGFKSIELEGIHEEHLTAVFSIKEEIREEIMKLKISVPYFCTVLPKLSSTDNKIRNHQLDLFKKGCEIAETIGSLGVLDNGPLPPYNFKADVPVTRHYNSNSLANAFIAKNLNWGTYWENLIDTFKIICDIAAEHNLTYQIHPAEGVLCSNTDGFLYFYEKVGKDNLRFNFDTANLFALKENLALSLHRLKAHIDYIHISDNRGERIEHLEIGKGNINWEIFFETIESIGFNGHLGLDIGGSESDVGNINRAYLNSADILENNFYKK